MTDNLNTNNNNNNLKERNQQALNNIIQLQQQEKDLYNSLDDVSLTPDQKEQIITKINEISQMRINIYSTLNDALTNYQNNITTSSDTLSQSIKAMDILETELNQSKARLNMLENQKTNKLRMIEINNYYGKRYNAHSLLMKTIVIICIPIIILIFFKNIIPPNIYGFSIGLILVIGMVIIGLQIVDMSNRDNMNWDEYNWYFNKSSAPSDTTEYNSESTEDVWQLPSVTCIGSACCSKGSVYDSEKNMCIINKEIEGMDNYGYNVVKAKSVNENIKPMMSKLTI